MRRLSPAARLSLCASAALLTGCASREKAPPPPLAESVPEPAPGPLHAPTPAEPAAAPDLQELLPGVWVSLAHKLVEFDALLAIDCHHPETPDVYLEVICCTPDTREHEALVVTSVAPSAIHAALLMLGADDGRPGAWEQEDGRITPIPPEGAPVEVTFLLSGGDGEPRASDPARWIVHAETGETLREVLPEEGWVFAGSRVRHFQEKDVYDADWTGQLIGLHTFGSETIAWTHAAHPDSGVHEPVWLANRELVPLIRTPVRVRIRVLAPEPVVSELSEPSAP